MPAAWGVGVVRDESEEVSSSWTVQGRTSEPCLTDEIEGKGAKK